MDKFNQEKENVVEKIENEKNELEILKSRLAEKEARILELETIMEELKENLIHDGLTKLKTRKYFIEEIEENISDLSNPESNKRKESFKHISCLFCDIDNFKEINDIYGHFLGDEILKEVADILKTNVRPTDTVCRWGGEEIVISLLGADEASAAIKAENLRKTVEGLSEKYAEKYPNIKISLSIGVASFELGLSAEDIIKRGDKAMYSAKNEGRNCVKIYSQVSEEI